MRALRKLWKQARGWFTPDVFRIAATFNRYFEVVRADTDAQREIVYFLRWQVYCEELDWQQPTATRSESDGHDVRSMHLLIRAKRNRQFIGTVRIVRPDPTIVGSTMPFEDLFYQPLDYKPSRTLTVETMALNRGVIGEISRLAIIKDYRRRSGEREQSHPWGFSDSNENQQWFPYVAAGLYLGAMHLALEAKLETLFFLALPRLAKRIENLGVNVQQIGHPIDHRGLRAPYMISPYRVVADLWPMFQPLYTSIARGLER